MNQNSECSQDLIGQYGELVCQPSLFLVKYYDELVFQIDVEVEQLILYLHGDQARSKQVQTALEKSCRLKHEPDVPPEQVPGRCVDALNKLRDNMISVVRLNQREALKHINHSSSFKALIEQHGRKLSEYKSTETWTLAQLEQDVHELKRALFLNKTILYVKNINDFQTKILTIQEEVDVEYLKRNNSDYYLKKKVPRSEARDVGHLIVIENLFLNQQQLDLFK